MATVMVCMLPEAGHSIPCIKPCFDLLDRGHRVVFLTCGHIVGELKELGFDTHQLFSADWPELADRSIFRSCGPAFVMYAQLAARLTPTSSVDALRSEIRRAAIAEGAELVLIDGFYGESICEAFVNAPFAVASVHVHLPHYHCEKAGSGNRIYLSPECFELPEYRDKDAYYTEPALYVKREADAVVLGWDKLDSRSALVYCSLGTHIRAYGRAVEFYRCILGAAVNAVDYQFVLNVGSASEELQGLWQQALSNVTIVSFVNQPAILSRSSAAIIHGGFGVIKECIYFGVPMLIYPQRWDQPMNAYRVERHGLGIHVNESQFSSLHILGCLRKLTSSAETADRIRDMQEKFVASQREQTTAMLCEAMIARHLCQGY